jgi:hypothetical protein
MCGVTIAAGIGIDSISLKSRKIADRKYSTGCSTGGRHTGSDRIRRAGEDRIWAEHMLAYRKNQISDPPVAEKLMKPQLQTWAREQRLAASLLPAYKKRVLERKLGFHFD